MMKLIWMVDSDKGFDFARRVAHRLLWLLTRYGICLQGKIVAETNANIHIVSYKQALSLPYLWYM